MQDHQPIKDQHTSRRIPLGIIAGLSAVVVAAGGGTAWWTWNSLTSTPADRVEDAQPVTPTPPSDAQPSDQTPTAPLVETEAQVYWVDVAGTEFELVPAPVKATSAEDPEVVLTAAFESLLNGPTETNAFSEIPSETKLLDISVEPDGVHVNLSEEFERGGGSASMMGRLGQVVYTATSIDESDAVWLSIAGEPVEYIGGEGIPVEQPMTRSDFDTLPF